MPWSGNPSTDEADAIRALVGDMVTAAPKLSDDVYVLVIAQESRLYARASLAASALAGKYAVEMTKRIGDLWREAKTLYTHYSDLAKWFRLEAQRRAKAIPFAGGISKADVEAREEDTDRVTPSFRVGMIDSVKLRSNEELTSDC